MSEIFSFAVRDMPIFIWSTTFWIYKNANRRTEGRAHRILKRCDIDFRNSYAPLSSILFICLTRRLFLFLTFRNSTVRRRSRRFYTRDSIWDCARIVRGWFMLYFGAVIQFSDVGTFIISSGSAFVQWPRKSLDPSVAPSQYHFSFTCSVSFLCYRRVKSNRKRKIIPVKVRTKQKIVRKKFWTEGII